MLIQQKVVNLAVGFDYELYIGSLLEKENYSVLYTGYLFGREDHRIDLIGVRDNGICLVQCKWKASGHVSEDEARYFDEGVRRFRNDFEFTGTASARFYTNQYFDSDSHEYLDNNRIQAIVKKMPEGYKTTPPNRGNYEYSQYIQNEINGLQLKRQFNLRGKQKAVLEFSFEGHNVLDGVAGSGKTVCAIKRAEQLASKNRKVLLLSYTNALIGYINSLLRDTDNITVTTYHKFVRHTMLSMGKPMGGKIISDESKRNIITRLVYKLLPAKGSTKLVEYAFAEIDWLEGYGIRTKEEYMSAERVGRGVGGIPIPRDTLFDIYAEYLTEREMQGYSYDWSDIAYYFFTALEGAHCEYDAIIVDEAQDLTRMQIKSLVKYVETTTRSLLYIGDLGQQIYGQGRVSWKRMDMSIHKIYHLDETYRNTQQITKLANAIRLDSDLEDEDILSASCDLEIGDLPCLIKCSSIEFEYKYVKRQARKNSAVGSVCVLSSKRNIERILNEMLSSDMQVEEINRESRAIDTRKGIFISTYHAVKGMEFDTVIICDCTNRYFESLFKRDDETLFLSKSNKLLYTVVSRAKKNLAIVYSDDLMVTIDKHKDLCYEYIYQ